jgi:8-oxo-dGTP pyrophosphatase MutT (NUDIX family)
MVWCYRKERGNLLVLVFRTTPERGDFWQPVTGSIEEGETFEEGALREAWEETGLTPLKALLDLGYEFEFESRWGGRVRERAYGMEVGTRTVHLDPKEHVLAEWVEPQVAEKMLKFPTNIEALRKLRRALQMESGEGSFGP